MKEKYHGKFRIKTTRLRNHNYGKEGFYFITICTKNRNCFFGEIINGQQILSESGQIAEKYWKIIPSKFDYASLDAFVIMPDHLHGIIHINKDNRCRDAIYRVSNKLTGGITGQKNPMLHNNISRIINWYKGTVTFEARKINPDFGWQHRFNDHIIRNQKYLEQKRQYIRDNPANWG